MILDIASLTQEKLAKRLDVSFATLNSWVNGRSFPRDKKIKQINELYLEVTGQKVISEDILINKKQIVKNQADKIKGNIIKYILENNDVYKDLVINVTYHTNSIEGSTLTKDETASILFDGVAIADKTAKELLEAKNHQSAFEYLLNHLSKKGKIDEALILKLHSILMNSILANAGVYRYHGVRIVGSNIPTANFIKVPILMNKLVERINKKEKDVISKVSFVHAEFEKIHPFSDGNGRIGRLILIAGLLKENLPPAVIKQEIKRQYYNCLNKAQDKADYSLLESFICDAVILGFKIINRQDI